MADKQKTGTWRDYVSDSPGSWRDYISDEDIAKAVSRNVYNRTNALVENNKALVTDYQSRYSGRKWTHEDAYVSDHKAYLDAITAQNSEFAKEAQGIRDYMDYYKDYLSEEWMAEVNKTLDGGVEQQTHILNAATQDSEYWSKWENEDAYKKAQIELGYQDAYSGKSVYELFEAMNRLPEGAEKDWLKGYYTYRDYTEKAEYDTAAAERELQALEKELEVALHTEGISGVNIEQSVARSKDLAEKRTRAENLKAYIESAKLVQQNEGYMSLSENADFEQGSQYVSTRTSVPLDNAKYSMSYGGVDGEGVPVSYTAYRTEELFGDFLYDYINRNPDALAVASANDVAHLDYFLGYDKGFLMTMEPNEVQRYNYLHWLDKTQGTNRAKEYLDFIESDLINRRWEQEQGKWSKYAAEKPFAASVFSVMISPLKSVSAVGQVLDYMDDGVINEKASYNKYSHIPTAIRTQVASKWGPTGSWMYQLGMSMGDFLTNSVVTGGNSALSLSLMGSGAMADTVISAKDRGLSDDQAMLLGVVAGGAEIITEKLPFDALFKGDLSKGTMRYILNNALAEGQEEVYSSLINTFADIFISKDKSEWAKAIEEYRASHPGVSESKAFQKVLCDTALSLGLDFLGGALMGGTMGTGGATINYFANARPGIQENIDAATKYGDFTKELIEEGLLSDHKSKSYDLAKYYQKKTEKGKTLSGYQIRTLVEANEKQFKVENYNEAVSQAKTRLRELGETENVDKIAKLAAKRATGQELNRQERSTLARSQFGAKVAKEMRDANLADPGATSSANKPFDKSVPATYKPLEDRVGTEPTLKVSDSGQATISESGEAIDLSKAEIVKIDKNGATLNVNGKDVKASEIDYADEDQSYLFDAVSKIENITPAAATAVVRDYDPSTGQSVSEYLNGVDEGFTYGYYGYGEDDLKAGEFAPKLTDTQMMSAYRLGQSARKISDTDADAPVIKMRTAEEAKMTVKQKKAKQKARIESDETEVYFMDGKTVTKFDEHTGEYDDKRMAGVNTAKFLSKLGIGGKYYFYESYVNADGVRVYKDANGDEVKAPNGMYKDSDGSIYIDLNAGNDGQGITLFTLAHELLHFIKDQSKTQFKVLCDLVTKAYSETDMSMRNRVLEKQDFLSAIRGEDVSYSEAYEEVVADAMSTMLSDGNFYEKIIEIKVKDKGLFNTIKRFFEKMIAKFTEVYKELTPDQKDAQDIRQVKDMFEKIQTAFAEALVEASDNFQAAQTQKNTTEDGGVDGEYDIKLSPREENAFKQFAKAINFVINQSISGKGNIDGKAQVKDIMPTGPKITAMVAASSGNAIDISHRNIALSSSDIWHEYKRHTQEKQEVSRGQIAFTKRQFQNAVKCIISPDIVETIFVDTNNPTQRQSFAYAKKTARGHYVVVEAVGGKKNPQIYPVLIVQFSKAKWNKMMAEGKSLGEMLHEGEPQKLLAQDVEKNKKSRVTAAQFASYEAIANTLRSPQLDTKVSQPDAEVKKNSDRYGGTSNRDLLANAFEGISQSSDEYKMIQKYKGRIKILNEYEEKLAKLNAQIREIRFAEGKYDAKRLRELETEAKKVAENINRNDKKLLSMEASEPLRKVIERERKKEAQKSREHVKEIQQNKKARAEQTELRHKIRKAIRDLDKILTRGNKQRNVKEDLQPVVTKALQAAEILFTDNYGTYDMLRNGLGIDLSDPEEALVKTCTQMLKDLDKIPTDGYENWQARQEAENRLRTKMSKLNEVFARERKRLNNTTVSSILGELADAYAKLDESEQSYVQGAYSEPVHNFLKSLQSDVGGTIVIDMTKDQLESVYAAYQMVLNTVRNANKMFNEQLKQSREQLSNAVIEEVLKAGGVHLLGTMTGSRISQFSWNNMKPIWVANRIGSDTFGKLMNGLFRGQYNFAVDIAETKQFKLDMDKKYNPRSWDAEKLYEFESSTGKKFSLNLQQIMSLYAFSKREQAYSHLLNGGFAFEKNSTVVVDGKLGIKRTYIHKGATSYKLNEATLNSIINSLTAEQKAYVDEMQKFLSDTMGAKGNEVSMRLYGIKMFKEKFYFPLRSSGDFMEKAKAAELKKEQGQINLVNSGFTHSVKPEAKNPIILSGFMDVWAEHCNEMSMYHSMVLPMEDFRKVYNYTTVHDDKMDSASVQQTIIDAYGDEATKYIDQLYSELNAGATIDPRETPYKKLISNFKKSAVMLSGSVFVQQFSSIGRAYAVIDPKYFAGAKVNSDTSLSAVEEMKKYAPVAIIKEMGGFDTGTKGSAKSYIMAERYAKGERTKGFIKDGQYRGDIMGFLPAWADQKTWCAIWEATKRETKAKNPKMDVKSEEFLKLAGERFSEVIEKTQVYDSVLARSANMRSKGSFMAMATAFMAEPTTTINLLEDAIRSGNAKHIARAFGSVAVSIVLNNVLASVVYAMRDDDEDETFIEKYFQAFTSGMIDDISPMTYYPFFKDVYSMFQGYDVERTDMSVIGDIRDAAKQVLKYMTEDTSEMDDDELAKHNKNLWGALGSLLDAGCSMFGVPVKNVRRDVNGLINAFKTVGEDISGERNTTWLSFWDNVGSAVKDTIPVYALVAKDKAKIEKLYEAIIRGDKTYLERLKITYVDKNGNFDKSKYDTAVRTALKENDPRIHAAAQARYDGNIEEYKRIFREVYNEGKFSFDDIMSAVNSEISAIRNKLEPEKETSQYSAGDFVEAVAMDNTTEAQAMRDDIIATKVANGKTQKEAEKEFSLNVATDIGKAYSSGLLDQAQSEKLLLEYTGMDEDEAASRVNYWTFLDAHPEYEQYDLSESNVNKYLEFAEPAGISMEVFVQFRDGTKGLETIKDKWGDVEKSVRDQTLEVIHSLPLTRKQKDALYLAAEFAESKIWDVPW